MNHYELSRAFFDWAFENPSKISPNHVALYFFAIEHCNRLGWKKEFGLPTTMAKEAIGIRSYNTYIKTLNELVEFGFIIMVEKSKNQYSSNIIALSKFDKALDKALDKAMIKHMTKRCESTSESIDSIDKQYNNITSNIEQTTDGDKSPRKQERDIYEGKEKFTEKEQDEFKRFNTYIDTNLPDVRKIKKQISITQYYNLKKLYGINLVMDKLLVIHNTPKYHTGKDKKADVYLTVHNWAKNYPTVQNSNQKNQTNEPTPIRMGKREAEALGLIPKNDQDDPNA